MRQTKWLYWIITWVLILIIAVISVELIDLAVKYYDYKHLPPTTQNPPPKDHSPSPLAWGVDTASIIDQSNEQCISKNYGVPAFVGRYLGDNGNVSSGLTRPEVQLLHGKNIKILPIHNHFTEATGQTNGQNEANEAIKLAKALGVKNGVLIMADIEPTYKVNADFIIGWTKTMLNNQFIPGVYGNLGNDELKSAYTKAAQRDTQVKQNLILWTNQPSNGVTGSNRAPNTFNGKSPNQDKTLVWQYGIKSKTCHIDTDLGKRKLLDLLW